MQSGVSQIRHSHSPSKDAGTFPRPPALTETIVPSYSINMDSPRVSPRPSPRSDGSTGLNRPVPKSKPLSVGPNVLSRVQ